MCARAIEVLESEEWSVCVRDRESLGLCVCARSIRVVGVQGVKCVCKGNKSLQVLRKGGVMCACEGVCVRGCVCEGNERLGV